MTKQLSSRFSYLFAILALILGSFGLSVQAASNQVILDSNVANFDLADTGSSWQLVWEKAGTIFYRSDLKFPETVASGTNPVLGLLSTGDPVIAYEANGQINVAQKVAGTWSSSQLGAATNPSLSVGPADQVDLVFETSDGSNHDIYLKQLSAGTWSAGDLIFDGQNVGSSTESFSVPQVQIGSDGFYRVLARETLSGDGGTTYYLQLKTNAGSGNTQSAAFLNSPILGKHNLALDESNNSYLVYDNGDAAIFRVLATSTNAWQETQIGGGAGEAEPSLAFKTANGPVGVVYNDGAGQLQFISGSDSAGFSAPNLVASGISALGVKPVLALGLSNKTIAYLKAGQLILNTDYSLADTLAPKIIFLGDNPFKLTVGGTYTEPGVKAEDNLDGDLSAQIVSTSSPTFDANAVGTYQFIYSVADTAGNLASSTRTVIVEAATVATTSPTIMTYGSSGGGGGGGGSSAVSGLSAKADLNGDGLVNLLDFNLLMINWGKK
jgi:hypothetical protein